jgi:hypothetical protein
MIDRLRLIVISPPILRDAKNYIRENKRIRKKSHRRLDYFKRLNDMQAKLNKLFNDDYAAWLTDHADEYYGLINKHIGKPAMVPLWKRLLNKVRKTL